MKVIAYRGPDYNRVWICEITQGELKSVFPKVSSSPDKVIGGEFELADVINARKHLESVGGQVKLALDHYTAGLEALRHVSLTAAALLQEPAIPTPDPPPLGAERLSHVGEHEDEV